MAAAWSPRRQPVQQHLGGAGCGGESFFLRGVFSEAAQKFRPAGAAPQGRMLFPSPASENTF
jgi:hypothetical protein